MSSKKTTKISTLGSQAASTISVALVLLILGVLASIGIATEKVTASVLGNVKMVVRVDGNASATDTDDLRKTFESSPFIESFIFTSADEVLKQEMDYNQEALELIEENPYSPEFELTLAPSFVNPDSINQIADQLALLNHVEEVLSQTATVKAVAKAASSVSLILSIVAAVLLCISIALIFNTVSIAIYARRFVIRTMQLVGATPGFIRKPFVLAGIFSGIVAGLIATALLICAQLYVASLSLGASMTLTWGEIALIGAGMTLIGIAICSLSALWATNRYLNASYDNLYS